MNREIKFRAWDDKNKKWLLGYDYENLGGFSLFGECVLMGEWKRVAYSFIIQEGDKEFEYLKVMQYTGLKDKNGTEIYEGDIWMYSDGSVKTHCEILFEDCRFKAIRSEDGLDMIEYYRSNILKEGEVIGNIYENPELLND